MNAAAKSSNAIVPGRVQTRVLALAVGLLGWISGTAMFVWLSVGPAEALPSYARQTGQPCAACHTAFPELTPFGRRFKIGGYTLGGGDWQGPPISAMYMAGFTHTQSPQDAPPAPGLHTNDNLVSQQVSGFVAGQLYGNLGSFIQITGDPVGGTVGLRRLRRPLRRYAQAVRQGHDLGHRRQQYADRGRPLEHDPFVWLAADLLDHRARIRAAVDPSSRTDTARSSAARARTRSGTTCSTPT